MKPFAENKGKKKFFKTFNKKCVHATKHFTVKPVKPKIRNKEIENKNKKQGETPRGESRTAATSKMDHVVIIVNDWKPLTIITESTILDIAAVLDPPQNTRGNMGNTQ